MKPYLALVAFSLFALHRASAVEERPLWTAASPDKKYFAAARTVPDPELVYRRDLDGLRLVIYSGTDSPTEIYASLGFPHYSIAHLAWSPDSRFLVFTTDSSGGHSPWHSPALVFSVADKSFHRMDEAIGSVLSPGKFRFEPPDIAVMGVQDTNAANKADTFRVRWSKSRSQRRLRRCHASNDRHAMHLTRRCS
jgi:hypothetical protein